MVKREISMPVVIAYLVLWWAGVFGLFVLMTKNSAPGTPVLKWEEEPLRTTTRLSVVFEQEATDPDGDKLNYFYQWSLNGEPIEHTGSSWSTKETRKGQTFEARVIADDGTLGNWGCSLPWRECAGDNVAVLQGTIGNSPPRPRILFTNADIEEGAVDDEGNEIDPRIEAYGKKMSVGLQLSCFDPDEADKMRDEMMAQAEAMKAAEEAGEPLPEPEEGDDEEAEEKPDPCSYQVAWYPADTEITEETEPFSTEMTLSRKELKESEGGWKVSVIANDGEDDGEPVEAVIYPEES